MPQVPTLSVPEVMPSRAPDVYQRFDVNADMFGGSAARGLIGLGRGLSEFGAAMQANAEKLSTEQDNADANNAYVSATIEKAQLGEKYYALEGKNAVDAYPKFTSDLEEIRKRHIASLGTKRAQKLFDNDFTRSAVSDITAGSHHAATENKKYVSDASAARVQTAINDSASRFSDQKAFDDNLAVIEKEVKNRSLSEGWSEDKYNLERDKTEGMAYAARIREMAIYNPYEAEKLYKENRNKIAPDNAIILENAIRTSKNTVGVRTDADMVKDPGMARPGLVGAMRFGIAPGRHVDLKNVDARLVDLAKIGSSHLPEGYRLQVNGGYTPFGHASGSQHHQKGKGALDLQIIDPQGHPIPNKGRDSTGLYTLLAKSMYGEMLARHPELKGQFAWGGTFGTVSGGSVPDLMHFDLGGQRGRLNPGGPSMEDSSGIKYGAPRGSLVERIIGAETSGGRDIHTSTAGAEGIMQILPDTARMVAAQHGLPFSVEALRSDHAYNMRLGTLYMNDLLKQFGGNETLAVAAYNAGPGRVQKWMQTIGDPNTGAITNEQWAAALPIKETRDYVAKVMSSGGDSNIQGNIDYGAPGTRVPLSERLARGKAMAQLHSPYDPQFEDNLLSRIRTDYTLEETARSEEQQAAYNLVGTAALGVGGAKPTTEEQILGDPAVRAAYESLDIEKQTAIHNLLKSNAVADRTETPEMLQEYRRLKGMRLTNPEGFKSEDVPANPILNSQLKKQLIDLQTVDPKKQREQNVNVVSSLQTVRSSLEAVGLWPKGDWGDDDKKRYDLFVGAFSDKLQQHIDEKKKKPTDAEVRAMASDLLQEQNMESIDRGPNSWLPFTELFPGGKVFEFELSKKGLQEKFNISPEVADIVIQAQIPANVRLGITQAYTKQNGVPPTDEIIWQIFRRSEAAKIYRQQE